ncbi:hypothetical protein PR048_005835 [Dryococelus australis]|uniref:Uncharacterized protein n=1 Tax=Dryococelus australis TaxID=614101 RepID=A0ABQ9IAI0_9NEOP|nr:hypothetical protein PR048_005835 [Dryococelus australis]
MLTSEDIGFKDVLRDEPIMEHDNDIAGGKVPEVLRELPLPVRPTKQVKTNNIAALHTLSMAKQEDLNQERKTEEGVGRKENFQRSCIWALLARHGRSAFAYRGGVNGMFTRNWLTTLNFTVHPVSWIALGVTDPTRCLAAEVRARIEFVNVTRLTANVTVVNRESIDELRKKISIIVQSGEKKIYPPLVLPVTLEQFRQWVIQVENRVYVPQLCERQNQRPMLPGHLSRECRPLRKSGESHQGNVKTVAVVGRRKQGGGKLYVTLEVKGKKDLALVDTGASKCFISQLFANQLVEEFPKLKLNLCVGEGFQLMVDNGTKEKKRPIKCKMSRVREECCTRRIKRDSSRCYRV